MVDPLPRAGAAQAARHLLVGAAAGAVALAALLAGREAVSVFVAVVLLAAYRELRRILGADGGWLAGALGGLAVLGFLWVAYEGRLERLPWVGAALILALLVAGVGVHEWGRRPQRATDTVGAALASAGIVGVLGAHVLLVRAVPGFGFRGLLVLGLMVFCGDAAALVGGRAFGKRPLAPRLSPSKTWEGALVAFATSIAVGVIAGLAADPPFDPRSGAALGAGVGVLAPLGDLAFSALKRSAGVERSGRLFGPMGGALDAVDGLLMAAPAFYWAFRTIAL